MSDSISIMQYCSGSAGNAVWQPPGACSAGRVDCIANSSAVAQQAKALCAMQSCAKTPCFCLLATGAAATFDSVAHFGTPIKVWNLLLQEGNNHNAIRYDTWLLFTAATGSEARTALLCPCTPAGPQPICVVQHRYAGDLQPVTVIAFYNAPMKNPTKVNTHSTTGTCT